MEISLLQVGFLGSMLAFEKGIFQNHSEEE